MQHSQPHLHPTELPFVHIDPPRSPDWFTCTNGINIDSIDADPLDKNNNVLDNLDNFHILDNFSFHAVDQYPVNMPFIPQDDPQYDPQSPCPVPDWFTDIMDAFDTFDNENNNNENVPGVSGVPGVPGVPNTPDTFQDIALTSEEVQHIVDCTQIPLPTVPTVPTTRPPKRKFRSRFSPNGILYESQPPVEPLVKQARKEGARVVRAMPNYYEPLTQSEGESNTDTESDTESDMESDMESNTESDMEEKQSNTEEKQSELEDEEDDVVYLYSVRANGVHF